MATKPTTRPAPAVKEEAPAAAPPKSKKLLIIGIALVVAIVAGVAVWFFTRGHAPAEGQHAEAAKAEPAHEAKFIPLGDNFTVNLQREEGDRYLQAGITLKVLQPELEDKIKAQMPEIRSKLLFLLSSKLPSELQTAEGKQKLIAEIITTVDTVLGLASTPATHESPAASAAASAPVVAAPVAPKTTGVVDVLFTSFIIQ